jgi:hypothetical protein
MNKQELVQSLVGGDTDGVIDLVERLINVEESGGGSTPVEWTIGDDGNIEISPSSNLDASLFSVVAPDGFGDNSPTGDLAKLVAEDGTIILEVDTWGDLTLQAALDSNAFLTIKDDDGQTSISTTALTVGSGTTFFQISHGAFNASADDESSSFVISNFKAGPNGGGDPDVNPYIFAIQGGDGAGAGGGYLFTVGLQGGISVWNGQGPADAETWRVTSDGYEVLLASFEPEDNRISPGEVWSYYDDTNGAAKYWRKAKTADGTIVKTSSIMS